MIAIWSLLLALSLAGPVVSGPVVSSLLDKRAGTPIAQGKHDGYDFFWWSDGQSDATYTNGRGGSFSVEWSNRQGNWFGGKGWNPGTADRIIRYTGTFEPVGNAYLDVYGWSKDRLTEYYIIENFGTYNPGLAGAKKGIVTSDGGTYDVYFSSRVMNGIDKTRLLQQYWSIRQEKRSNGTITTGNHFAAFEKAGMQLKEHEYMLLAVEGYFSAGHANITILS